MFANIFPKFYSSRKWLIGLNLKDFFIKYFEIFLSISFSSDHESSCSVVALCPPLSRDVTLLLCVTASWKKIYSKIYDNNFWWINFSWNDHMWGTKRKIVLNLAENIFGDSILVGIIICTSYNQILIKWKCKTKYWI